jgi:hypothetical protein
MIDRTVYENLKQLQDQADMLFEISKNANHEAALAIRGKTDFERQHNILNGYKTIAEYELEGKQ